MNIWVHMSERKPSESGFYRVADKVMVRSKHHFWDGERWYSTTGRPVDYVDRWLDQGGDDHGDD